MTTNHSSIYFTSSKNYWDFTNIHGFEKKQVREIIWEKYHIYMHEDDILSKKYNMGYNSFLRKYNSLKQHSSMERNEDIIRWKRIMDILAEYDAFLNRL
jgi:hypothetical protein